MLRAFGSLFVVWILVLVPDASGSTADDSSSWSLPRFSDDSAALYKAASSVASPPGSDAIILDEEHSYVFDSEGRTVHTRYLSIKF
jgi:hypothetical protein